MKTPENTLKTYRAAWWVGVAMWIINLPAMAQIIRQYWSIPEGDYFMPLMMTAALLVPLTYFYLLFWFMLSTDWWIRNRRVVQLTVLDKIRWIAVILVLIIRPIIIA